MRLQKLFVAGFVLLLLLFVYSCGGITTCGGGTPEGATTPVPGITPSSASSAPQPVPPQEMGLVSHTTVPALKIEADFPPMQVNQQVFIAVAIFPTGAPKSVSDVKTVENATPVVTKATPVGTPGSTLVNAFGPNQSVIATATLVTSPTIFSVSPTGPQTKPLDQNRIEWDWTITPLVAGEQRIGVDIEAQWTSTTTVKQSLSYTLGYPKFLVSVQAIPVESTPTSTSQTSDNSGANATIWAAIITTLGVIIAAFITALFAIPSFRHWVGGLFERAHHP